MSADSYPARVLGLKDRSDIGMSNLFMKIDDEVEEVLRAGCYVAHSAWDHYGLVWMGGDGYAEEVWTHHVPREVIWAPSLRELMDAVNEKYGDA